MSFDFDRAEIREELRRWASNRDIAYLTISVIGCEACMALDGITYSAKRALKDMPLPNPACATKPCVCVFVGTFRDEVGATSLQLDYP